MVAALLTESVGFSMASLRAFFTPSAKLPAILAIASAKLLLAISSAAAAASAAASASGGGSSDNSRPRGRIQRKERVALLRSGNERKALLRCGKERKALLLRGKDRVSGRTERRGPRIRVADRAVSSAR